MFCRTQTTIFFPCVVMSGKEHGRRQSGHAREIKLPDIHFFWKVISLYLALRVVIYLTRGIWAF